MGTLLLLRAGHVQPDLNVVGLVRVELGNHAAVEHHGQLVAHRDAGRGVLLVSAELWEILALSTTIVVMFDGRVVAQLDPHETDDVEIGLYMTGAKEQQHVHT